MKITKRQLRRIIKEAFPVKGKAVGNFLKKGRAGRKLTMQGREYIDLGKGHWQGPDGEKLNWVQLSSMASALGDEMVRIDNNPRISETKITKNQLRRIIREEKARLSEMKLMDPALREQLATQGGDEALREIQNAMGITDGGVAGQWPGFGRLVDLLIDYINFEESNR